MVLGTGMQPRVITRPPRSEQLMLPFDVDGDQTHKVLRHTRDFARGFGPRLGAQLLMRVGVPMVAATTPAVIRTLDDDLADNMVPNLLVGSALGGAWGAAVGTLIPLNSAGVRVSRIRSAGSGAAGGILLAPAVAMASKLALDWVASPIRDDSELGPPRQTPSVPRQLQ